MSLNKLKTMRGQLDNPAALLGAAAAGFAVGLAANLGRKAAVQSLTTFKGQWDEGLKAEHRLTIKLFDALESTTASRFRAALAVRSMSRLKAAYRASFRRFARNSPSRISRSGLSSRGSPAPTSNIPNFRPKSRES